jgi:hypothetical protein
MKFTLFLLSAAAMVNAASSTDPVGLGTAGDYAILSKAGISTTPGSYITGSIAVSPIAATAITGFGLTAPPGEYSTSSLVSVQVKAANYAVPTPSKLTTAVGDMEIAYADAAGRSTGQGPIQDFNAEYGKVCVGTDSTDSNCLKADGTYVYDNLDKFLNLGVGEIGGLKLIPGVYTFDKQVNISAGHVTFVGGPTDVFIIQTSKGVLQADGENVVLEDNAGILSTAGNSAYSGPQAKNIFWSVAEEVNIGTGSTMNGVLLVATKVAIKNGSTVNGRILAQTAVTLDANTITQPPQ